MFSFVFLYFYHILLLIVVKNIHIVVEFNMLLFRYNKVQIRMAFFML